MNENKINNDMFCKYVVEDMYKLKILSSELLPSGKKYKYRVRFFDKIEFDYTDSIIGAEKYKNNLPYIGKVDALYCYFTDLSIALNCKTFGDYLCEYGSDFSDCDTIKEEIKIYENLQKELSDFKSKFGLDTFKNENIVSLIIEYNLDFLNGVIEEVS